MTDTPLLFLPVHTYQRHQFATSDRIYAAKSHHETTLVHTPDVFEGIHSHCLLVANDWVSSLQDADSFMDTYDAGPYLSDGAG